MTDTVTWVAAGTAEMDTSTLPCSQQLSLQILVVFKYWWGIRIGSLHLALTKADQSCQSFGDLRGPFHSIAPWTCSYMWIVHMNWNSYILHVSVEPKGQWAQWAAGLSDQCYWPLDLCLNCTEGTMGVMAENSLAPVYSISMLYVPGDFKHLQLYCSCIFHSLT